MDWLAANPTPTTAPEKIRVGLGRYHTNGSPQTPIRLFWHHSPFSANHLSYKTGAAYRTVTTQRPISTAARHLIVRLPGAVTTCVPTGGRMSEGTDPNSNLRIWECPTSLLNVNINMCPALGPDGSEDDELRLSPSSHYGTTRAFWRRLPPPLQPNPPAGAAKVPFVESQPS